MAKYKAGDKVVFGRCKVNKDAAGITIGRIYQLVERDGSLCFLDDDKDVRHGLDLDCSYKITKIVE